MKSLRQHLLERSMTIVDNVGTRHELSVEDAIAAVDAYHAQDRYAFLTERSAQPAPVKTDGAEIVDLVKVDLDQRRSLGVRTYGTPLQAHNGRDALYDAYEEALDLTCYLRQVIEERTT